MYESPIELITSQVSEHIEEETEKQVMTAVYSLGVNVDKDELIKALAYDRQQYAKGVNDAISVLKPNCKYLIKCMAHPETSREYCDWCTLHEEVCTCRCVRLGKRGN